MRLPAIFSALLLKSEKQKNALKDLEYKGFVKNKYKM